MNRASDGGPRAVWVGGWMLTWAVALFLLMSAGSKFLMTDGVLAEFERLEQDPSSIRVIGVAQLSGVLLYVWPRTGVVGAILITAYMGGGVALHGRVGESVLLPVGTAVLCWLGLVLRDERVRRVTPWRRSGAV